MGWSLKGAGCFLIFTTSPLHPAHSSTFSVLFCAYGRQSPRWPTVNLSSCYSHPCVVTSHIDSESVWPTEYGRGDNMWFSRLGYKRHYSFHFDLLNHSLCGNPGAMSRGHSSSPAERPIWGRTKVSCQQPSSRGHSCEWATLKGDPPVLGKPLNDCSPSWHLDCRLMWDPGPEPR